MLKFLKKYWIEILVTAIVLALFIAFAVLAPYLFAGLAITSLSGGVFYGVAALVFGFFAAAFTNEIRNRDEPDWPWFEGITGGSYHRQVTPEAASELALDSPVLAESENADDEATPLLDSVASSSPPLSRRASSVKDRLKQFQASLQANGADFSHKHETSSTTILLTKINEARPVVSNMAARKGELSTEFVADMREYCRHPENKSLATLFQEKPRHLTMCMVNKLIDAKGDDLTEEAKAAFNNK